MDNVIRKRPRILLIDDDPHTANCLVPILTAAGYEVREAQNGRLGVQIALSEPLDLVITNIVMPEQDGLETILILRDRQPNLRIIAMDEVAHDLYLTVAQRLGARHTVVKPVSGEKMLDLVQSLMASDTFFTDDNHSQRCG